MSVPYLLLGALVGLWLLAVVVFLLATWRPRLRRHVTRSCVTCGLCCCPECREARRRAPWRAPRGGGYHGCSPAHRTTDPACGLHRPPRTRWQRWQFDRARGLACPLCTGGRR
ncbi:hypothetical protein ACQP60_04275 [Isoptericola variabilis]|uniref:hypothetical protein n=1 Tax=Isoptericola variabilis TaxID=139208 RepID=UPI003D1DEC25